MIGARRTLGLSVDPLRRWLRILRDIRRFGQRLGPAGCPLRRSRATGPSPDNLDPLTASTRTRSTPPSLPAPNWGHHSADYLSAGLRRGENEGPGLVRSHLDRGIGHT